MGVPKPAPAPKLVPSLKRLWGEDYPKSFFLIFTLISIGSICSFAPDKLALLNFYFIPTLLAAYYLNCRKTTVLAVLLSIGLVFLFAYFKPESFYMEHTPACVFLHLISWGSFLLLCGFLGCGFNANLQERIAQLKREAEQGKPQGQEPSALEILRSNFKRLPRW